ncbi:putative mannosyltransferase Ecym_7035 [Eremothecium cymbalariae DBVPG|uniref:Glycosyltransferase family 15 protein n=1 Tax=Eremothecium cymbalariae (strain CBS 270.75 / DBVPG 7215 / KCTC 17166 / NRRL Y-17582) TaxID=931890 RepID=G8JVM6_ERECY|nr:hypothetical protein Ecym_7035 [Eremothecium cymbalariae DBVPG\
MRFRRYRLKALTLYCGIVAVIFLLWFNMNAGKDPLQMKYKDFIYRYQHIALDLLHWSTNSYEKPGIKNDPEVQKLLERLDVPLYNDQELSNPLLKTKALEDYKNFMKRPIDEPKVEKLIRKDDELSGKTSATILCLVRNEDLNAIIRSMKELEHVFNNDFKYPYTFLNDEPFTTEFKARMMKEFPGRVLYFGTIDHEMWSFPSSLDMRKYKRNMKILKQTGVGYAELDSYHHMCRFYSKFFYKHPLLQQFRYVWRLEPDVKFYCKIEYDVFHFMNIYNKVYGFTLNLYDNPISISTLWPTTLDFLQKNPQHLHKNGAFEWLKENAQKPDNFEITFGYSTCHFWTNFELIDLKFLRSEAYESYVKYLDDSGGFYYERWGDAPVRSIALALFANKSDIHWFRDIPYYHMPYTNCPLSSNPNKCSNRCIAGSFCSDYALQVENCMGTWINYSMTKEDQELY